MVVGNINAKPSSATKTKSDLVGLSMRTSREEYLFHQGGHKGGSDKENVFSSLLFSKWILTLLWENRQHG